MKEKNIYDTGSYKKLRDSINGANSLKIFMNIFGGEKLNTNEAFKQLPELKEKIEHLTQLPDAFNNFYKSKGLIAHETMNSSLMEEAINLGKNNKIEEGELLIVDFYSSKQIEWLKNNLRSISHFKLRYQLIQESYKQTLSQNFFSVVPLLLLIIDGVVMDIDKNKGFFSHDIDLLAWDSIAGHSSGLTYLRDLYYTSRKKRTTQEIRLPYRNGILHGRDLNFGNKYVAAKCWLLLFAIKDWADSIKKGNKNPPEVKSKSVFQELKELNQSIKNYQESKKKNEIIHKKVEAWKPRTDETLKQIPNSQNFLDYDILSPERAAIEFSYNWKEKKYGKLVPMINRPKGTQVVISTEAGKIREIYSDKELQNYEITNIKDESPAITVIEMKFTFLHDEEIKTKTEKLRFLNQGTGERIAIHGDPDSKWELINDNFIYSIEFP